MTPNSKREPAAGLPAFTADASLPDAGHRYGTWQVAATSRESVAVPQLGAATRRFGCIPNCICSSPIDCPCCDTFQLPWPEPYAR